MMRIAAFVPLALLGVLAACSPSPTAPADELPRGLATAPLPDLSAVAADIPTAGSTQPQRAPLLHRLVGMSISKVQEMHGSAPAEQMRRALGVRHEALRAAIESGNPVAVRQAHRALDAFSAELVLRVFGPPMVGHVMHTVAMQVQRVSEAVNQAAVSGHDVSGPRQVLSHVSQLLQAARGAAEAGQPAAALLRAAHAADVLHTVFGGPPRG